MPGAHVATSPGPAADSVVRAGPWAFLLRRLLHRPRGPKSPAGSEPQGPIRAVPRPGPAVPGPCSGPRAGPVGGKPEMS
jgi:hypothetical protein